MKIKTKTCLSFLVLLLFAATITGCGSDDRNRQSKKIQPSIPTSAPSLDQVFKSLHVVPPCIIKDNQIVLRENKICEFEHKINPKPGHYWIITVDKEKIDFDRYWMEGEVCANRMEECDGILRLIIMAKTTGTSNILLQLTDPAQEEIEDVAVYQVIGEKKSLKRF
ncbi:MAG: hypothetical protein HQK53_15310 [Oligoflexia bacterium]|nr:hypothetical protein [Oligoflexia bacterium]